MGSKESYAAAYRELMQTVAEIGLPEETGKLFAKYLGSEIGIRRMISYLRNAHPHSMTEIADELIAIMDDRSAWIRKKQAQESNSKLTAWLNSDLREIEDED